MTHITLSKTTNSKPCLEFYSDGGLEPRRVQIERFPFRIGRAESADLRVESAEVSREHVEISARNGVCIVRDLGSTNGTQVNGKPIKETMLADGDILKVAETELTFIASAASQFQRMVTQPIQAKKPISSAASLPTVVAATRWITEATLWQAIPSRIDAVRSLRTGTALAYFAPLSIPASRQPLFEHPAAVVERFRQLNRMIAVELAVEHDEARQLFLAVDAPEVEFPNRLVDCLNELGATLPAGWQIGVTISLPTDVDILRITDVYRHLRDEKLLVAFDEFQGNGGQVMHLQSLLPDYLVLAANMTKDLATTRQPLRRLESLVAACNEMGIRPVLPREKGAHERTLCQEIGFDLVLQPTTGGGTSKTDARRELETVS